MNHKTTDKFWKRYDKLPEAIQDLANKNLDLLKSDPSHPSLHFKEIQGQEDLWAARVGLYYRALATQEGDDLYWFWIGPHAEYDRILSQ